MNRRKIFGLLGGAAATPMLWPVSAAAQQSTKISRIGVIGPRPENAAIGAGYPAMLGELRKLGFSEGRNLTVEYRIDEQDASAIFAGAAELVRSKVDVIVRPSIMIRSHAVM